MTTTTTSDRIEAPAAPAALPPATTIAAVLARMIPNVPTAEDLERLRLEAESARTAASQAADRVKRLQAEIEGAMATAQPRPELAAVMAGLTAVEIEARVKVLELPAGHADRVVEARSAIAAAEARRFEAELVVPALESLKAETHAKARCTRAAFDYASGAYGTALALHSVATRYFPAVATALQIEAEIAQIEDAWGGNVSFEIHFLDPITGHRWKRREVEHVIEKEAARLSESQEPQAAQ